MHKTRETTNLTQKPNSFESHSILRSSKIYLVRLDVCVSVHR